MKTTIIYTLFWGAVSFSACEPAKNTAAKEEPKAYPVLTLKPQKAELATTYPATLLGEQTVEIRSKVEGYIEQVEVEEGAAVTKGQLLFKIDANSFQQEVNHKKAAVLAAEANLETASIQTQRTTALVDKKIVNSFELTSARNTERMKRAELSQAKADLSAAKSKLAFTHIVSPINGVVGSLPYKTGSLVSSTSEIPMTTVANTKNIYAYFSLSQQQLNAFLNQYPGHQVKDKFKNMPLVSLLMADGENYALKGKIQTLSGILNASTGAANFKAIFPNPEGKLWSGASAVISIPIPFEHAILVPKKAVFELQGKYFVYQSDQQHTVRTKEIEIMNSVTEKDYVVKKGLVAGDKVITEGLGTLKDGMKIKPLPSSSK